MKRSKFSLSNYKLLTCDMGELVPIGMYEALPGDSIQQATSALVRCSPLLAPVMHPVTVRIHHWFVPYRLLWSEFEDFITAGPAGISLPTFPTITMPNPTVVGSLADYLGIPSGLTNSLPVSALPFRAYQMIFNEHYRDQDLVTEAPIVTTSGNDATTSTTLQRVAWEKDYFTSARPWEQKGPQVTIPLGTAALVRTAAANDVTGVQQGVRFREAGTGNFPASTAPMNIEGTTGAAKGSNLSPGTVGNALYPTNLYADLSNASAITVTALRQALALQSFEEARARYGSRYVEYLRYLGVRSSDARLQRPEYLGGGRQTIQFSEVLATAASTTPATSVGEMKGHGISAMRSNRYRRFFEEHGVVMSLMSVLPKTMYVQGIARHWNRRTKEEFWQREFQHIGQQAIKNKEVYGAAAAPDATFGYQDRYDEYRRTESTIAGEFRTTALDYWHMGRTFASEPALNASFVTSTPSKRNFASQSTDVLYVMAKHNIQARRQVAKVGTSFIR